MNSQDIPSQSGINSVHFESDKMTVKMNSVEDFKSVGSDGDGKKIETAVTPRE